MLSKNYLVGSIRGLINTEEGGPCTVWANFGLAIEARFSPVVCAVLHSPVFFLRPAAVGPASSVGGGGGSPVRSRDGERRRRLRVGSRGGLQRRARRHLRQVLRYSGTRHQLTLSSPLPLALPLRSEIPFWLGSERRASQFVWMMSPLS